jgi:CRISPR-associated protein Csd2
MGNAPRIDPETFQGLVSDVCIKRKIREFVALMRGPDQLYIKSRGVLVNEHKEAYEKTGQTPGRTTNALARKYMCDNRWDVRTFGALMTTGQAAAAEPEVEDGAEGATGKKAHLKAKTSRFDCGAVRGPVQVSFARTISPISIVENAITRVALTNSTDGGGSTDNADGTQTANSGTIGQKYTVPYGLYRGTISVNPYLAQDTGYSEEDNELFLSALVHMLDNDASAARANVAVRKVYVWTHEPDLGAAPNHRLFDSLDIRLKETVEFPRQFSDYNITVATPPEGVTLVELVDGLDV